MAKQPMKPFRRGIPLRGLGVPAQPGEQGKVVVPLRAGEIVRPEEAEGLGEVLHDPRYYYSEPTPEQVQAMPARKGPVAGGPKATPASPRRVIDEQDLPLIRTIPPVAKTLIISSFIIDNTRKQRVDVGVRNRIDLLLWNVSNNVIWWDTSGNPAPPPVGGVQGSGAPLPGNATPGGYNGGSVSINAGPEVQIWAIGTVALPQMIVVFESARQ